MSIVTEIAIVGLANGSGGMLSASVALSQAVLDTTTIFSQTLQGVYTGSWPGNVNSWDQLEITTGPGFLTGSWPGNVNTWDQYEILASGTNMGLWPGNNNNGDLYHVPTDIHDTTTISNDQPNSAQGSVLVEWNHFPFPPEIPPEPLTNVRDLTRFQKAYSFQRQQPVRIRFYRK